MLRYRAATAIDWARIPRAVLSLRNVTGLSAWITVLAYHRVAPASAAGDFEEGTIDVTPEMFDEHVAFATRWFDVIGLDDLLSFARGGHLPKNPLLFTFDDGYLDNLRAAVPILQKHQARATFFIATTYVSDRRIFWWDHLSYMVKRSTRERIEIKYPTPIALPFGTSAERRRAQKQLTRFIKEEKGIDLWRFLDEVAEATGVSLGREDEQRLASEMILTWDDIKTMRAAGMDIQSHTCDHSILTTLSNEQLRRELRQSREILEGVLREPIRAISYPLGRGLTEPALRDEVTSAGYELGFSNASGVNHRWHFDPLNVRRIAIDIDSPGSYFRTMLAVPYIVP